jgi:hypothetical protein
VRIHRAFPDLQPWASLTDRVREFATVDHLVAARIEPVTRGREPAALLDLTFVVGDASLTIPLISIDLAQLDVREVDPLVFPAAYAGVLDDARAHAFVERLVPDLERRAHAGGFAREEVIAYGDLALFERARAEGLFGAAPLTRSIPAVAAAVYARRFARNARVLAYGPLAAQSAAFVRGLAASVVADGADGTTAADWYGIAGGRPNDDGYDLAIGAGVAPARASTTVRTDAGAPGLRVIAVEPLPGDLLLSFDPDDGAPAASFAVQTEREPFRRDAAAIEVPRSGGSAGRIALVVRPDGLRVPDSDTDEAAALAEYLRGEGFTAEIVASVDALAASAPDLVHLFGVRPGGFALDVAAWTRDRNVPLAVHAYSEEPAQGGHWGTLVAPYCFGYSADDRSVTSYLDLLGRRAVEVDGVAATAAFAPAAVGLDDGNRVLRSADIVFVQSERERAAVERVRPAGLTLVVPPLPLLLAGEEPVGVVTGHDPFIFVHAPIGPMHNQLIVARAAAEVGMALVLAGPVEDPAYAERLREFAASTRFVGRPSAGALAVLYRTAAIVADAAWVTRGHARLATAAAAGAAIVVSSARWLDLPLPERARVDPADTLSVARGIGEALDAATRNRDALATVTAAARERLALGGIRTVAGYAKIASAV